MKKILSAGAGIFTLFSLLISSSPAQPGSLDITFNPGTGADEAVNCIAIQTNGQLIVAGSFTGFNGVPSHRVVRLNPDGSVDTNYDVGQGPDGSVYCLAVQTDGKAVIGGTFASINGYDRRGVARLRTDGSLDLSFDPGTGASGSFGRSVNALVLQPDGKIIIGGDFTSVNGTSRNYIARLDSNGTLDLSFDPGTGANQPLRSVAIQTNGAILIGGAFTTFNDANRRFVARLDSYGNLDTSFIADPIIGGSVVAVLALPSNQILIGGDFTTINGYTRIVTAHLNSDGTLDTSFNRGVLPVNPNWGVYRMVLQPDGKVIVGEWAGVDIYRLHTNGVVDASFSVGSGPDYLNDWHSALFLQPDGKILVGGNFGKFNGTNINRIVRLNGDDTPPAGAQFLSANLYFGTWLTGTVSNTYRMEWTSQFNTPSFWTPLFNVTLQANPQFILDPNPVNAGERYYRAVMLP